MRKRRGGGNLAPLASVSAARKRVHLLDDTQGAHMNNLTATDVA